MKRSIEDDILQDGVNSALMAGPDGSLIYGWEVRIGRRSWCGTDMKNIIDQMVDDRVNVDPIALAGALQDALEVGLMECAAEDEIDIAC